MIIRNETPSDFEEISQVAAAAFRSLEISRHTEQFIIEALRRSGALTISLVAVVDGPVVGHIAFSPIHISDGSPNWHGLGPLCVLPEYQRQGIGTALVNEGLSLLKSMGSDGCTLVGHPDYYRRFGFGNIAALACDGVPPEVFMALPFGRIIPQGNVVFHEGFSATE